MQAFSYMNITLHDLLDAGVHLGHKTRRWNPKSKPYIFSNSLGMSIINLENTYNLLKRAIIFLEETVARGGDVMFIGTKLQAKNIMRDAATTCGMPFVINRWIGGSLTNWKTIKRSLYKYKHYLEMDPPGVPSKETAVITREMVRMRRNFEGILDMKCLPKVLYIIDIHREIIAVSEARSLKIPVVALVDTNSDPTCVDYPIPGNDDTIKSIRVITNVIIESVLHGLSLRKKLNT